MSIKTFPLSLNEHYELPWARGEYWQDKIGQLHRYPAKRGRPIAIDRYKVKELANRGLSMRGIARKIGCNVSTISRVLHNL